MDTIWASGHQKERERERERRDKRRRKKTNLSNKKNQCNRDDRRNSLTHMLGIVLKYTGEERVLESGTRPNTSCISHLFVSVRQCFCCEWYFFVGPKGLEVVWIFEHGLMEGKEQRWGLQKESLDQATQAIPQHVLGAILKLPTKHRFAWHSVGIARQGLGTPRPVFTPMCV